LTGGRTFLRKSTMPLSSFFTVPRPAAGLVYLARPERFELPTLRFEA
jgi:hypothetical protein